MGKWIFSAVLALSACAQDEHKHVGHSHGAGTSGRKQLCNGFMPENDMWIPEDPSKVHAYAVTRAQFDSVLNRLYSLYASEIARRGAQLVIERNWSDGTVNAYAYREGGNWIISMFGGFARHPSITYDGFASVACHELGHHLGGAPLYSGDWASVEGQSDYYATNKCLKRLFEREDNEKILSGRKLDPVAVRTCEAEHRGAKTNCCVSARPWPA